MRIILEVEFSLDQINYRRTINTDTGDSMAETLLGLSYQPTMLSE